MQSKRVRRIYAQTLWRLIDFVHTVDSEDSMATATGAL